MRAAVWYAQKDVRVEQREQRDLTATQVKIKVNYAGICGSDLHAYQDGAGVQQCLLHPLSHQKAPLILGHEFSGKIVEVGAEVSHLAVGQRVVVEPLYFCKHCQYCLSGKYNLCENFGFVGLNSDGGFADYANVEAYMVHPIPDALSDMEAALVEPTAVALFAVRQSTLKVGQKVVIWGAGPIGLLTALCAKAAGASEVYVIDIFEERLALARQIGARTINSTQVDNVVDEINRLSQGIDICFECAGVQATLDNAVAMLKKGGELVIIAAITAPLNFNFFDVLIKELNIRSTLAYRHVFPEVISLIAEQKLDVKKVITKVITLEQIVAEGLEKLQSDKSQAKILINLN